MLATRQISARPAYAVVQVSALAVGLLALVLLVLLRTDLIGSWRKATPPDAPNRFVINVMPEQSEAFQKALRDAGVQRSSTGIPMIRGRLVAVNGKRRDARRLRRRPRQAPGRPRVQPVAQRRSSRRTTRWSAGAGQPEETGAVSVEEGIANTLGLKLGDTLRFDIGGMPERREDHLAAQGRLGLDARQLLRDVPGERSCPTCRSPTWAPSARPAAARASTTRWCAAFPNITNVDMSSTIAQVQRVLDQVIRAVEFLFGFTLAAGLVVLFAAVTATREERAREFAIMRAVGARGRLLRQVQRAELAGVGLLAGFLASIVALAVGWGLARYVFDFTWTASPLVPLVGGLAGAVLALAAGWWGLREVLNPPVVETLRKAQ